jgi:hypothetical protein
MVGGVEQWRRWRSRRFVAAGVVVLGLGGAGAAAALGGGGGGGGPAPTTPVAGGSTIGGFVVYKYVTNDAGSTPILFIDTTDTATNGGDIVLQFDSGTNKIFKLS